VTRVARLLLTPVKSLRLAEVEAVAIGPHGVEGDRAFFLLGADGSSVRGPRRLSLCRMTAQWADGVLTIRLPDGTRVAGEPAAGTPVRARGDMDHEVAAESPARRAARDILSWIIREGITVMTSREATRAVRWLEKDRAARDEGLGLLVDPHGVLRRAAGRSGTREVRWLVNPKVHEDGGRVVKADKPGAGVTDSSGLPGLTGDPNTPSEDR
jgi:uncharacterized protein YcbX